MDEDFQGDNRVMRIVGKKADEEDPVNAWAIICICTQFGLK